VREKLIDFLQKEHPEALPRSRQISVKEDPKPEEKSEGAVPSQGAARKRATRQKR